MSNPAQDVSTSEDREPAPKTPFIGRFLRLAGGLAGFLIGGPAGAAAGSVIGELAGQVASKGSNMIRSTLERAFL